ncbi:hypothetical protein XELAEV_18003632mg [Xenopus laevis]|uniref:Uncharacterized protein n=1 Tax=Xenopus laevis TaxID=8355 RepID=A0A974BN47_XENLA|nr:hypothetical protein XELAEV_18003632mg [Xenopus laevis]
MKPLTLNPLPLEEEVSLPVPVQEKWSPVGSRRDLWQTGDQEGALQDCARQGENGAKERGSARACVMTSSWPL